MQLVVIDSVTGNVVGEWSGGDAVPTPLAGTAHIDVTGLTGPFAGKRWDSGTSTFVAVASPPLRVISTRDFMRRFTSAERRAIDTLGEPLTDQGQTVRDFMRLLLADRTIDLDNDDTADGLALIKAIGIPTVWADIATADARIAEILT